MIRSPWAPLEPPGPPREAAIGCLVLAGALLLVGLVVVLTIATR